MCPEKSIHLAKESIVQTKDSFAMCILFSGHTVHCVRKKTKHFEYFINITISLLQNLWVIKIDNSMRFLISHEDNKLTINTTIGDKNLIVKLLNFSEK